MVKLILMGIGVCFVISLIKELPDDKVGGFLILAAIVGGIGLMFSPIAAFVAFAVIVFLCGDG